MPLRVAEVLALFAVDDSEATSTLDAFPGKVKGMATAVAASAVVVGGALAAGIAGAMNVEAANAKLAAQLGLTASESERLGGVAGRLYSGAYGDSLETVNSAVAAVVSSIGGMRTASDADVEAMTAKALNLAEIFDIDVARAAQVAGQMISSGLAKDGTEAMDLLTASMQRVPAAVREDILDAVDEYGPFMQTLGLDGEEAFGLLVAASEKGAFGIDKTGDALTEFTKLGTDMSTRTGAAYETLGLSQEDMTAKLLAGGDSAAGAFEQIVNGLTGMKDPVAQSQAALALFGTPLEDLNTSEIPKFLESLSAGSTAMSGFAGTGDEVDAALAGTASNALASFGRQAKLAFVDIVGGQALPAAKEVATFLAANFGPALATAGGIVTGTLIPALKSGTQWLTDNAGKVRAFATVIGVLLLPRMVVLGATALTMGAQAVLGWTMTTAAMVAAQARAIITAPLIIAQWVAMAAGSVLHAATVVGSWLLVGAINFVGAVASFVGFIGTMAMTAARAAVSAATTAAQWAVAAARTVASLAVMGAGFVAQGAAMVASAAATAARVVAGWVLMGTQSLIQAARMAAAWLIAMGPVGWVIAAVIALAALIIANWSTIKKWTGAAWDWVTSKVTSAVTAVKRSIVSAFAAYLATVTKVQNAIKSAVGAAWGWVKNTVSSAVDWVKRLIVRGFAAYLATVRSVQNSIKAAVGAAWNWVSSKIGGVVSAVTGFMGNLRSRAAAIFSAIKAGIVSRIGEVVATARRIATFVSQVVGHFSSLKNRAVAKARELVSWMRGLPGKLVRAVGGLSSRFASVGRDVIAGMVRGVWGGVGKLKNAVRNAASAALDAAKNALGISSPSKVFEAQVGAMIAAGTARGILGGVPGVQAAMGQLTRLPTVPVNAPTFARGDGSVADTVTTGAAAGFDGLTVGTINLQGKPREVVDELLWEKLKVGG